MTVEGGGDAGTWGRGYVSFNKAAKFRRKKVQIGDAIIEDLKSKESELERAKKLDQGPYCKECRRRRSWRDLECRYERRGSRYKTIVRLWICKTCQNVLKEDEL